MKTRHARRLLPACLLATFLIALVGGCSDDDDPGGTGDPIQPWITRITTDPSYDGNPVFTADGGHLVFDSERDAAAGYSLWRVEVGAKAPTQLTTEHALAPTLHGSTLYFKSNRNGGDLELFSMPAAGGDATLVAGVPDDAVLSPDGNWWAFAGDTGHIWRRPFDLAAPAQLLTDQGDEDGAPCWSPDSQRIAFRRGDPASPDTHIWVMDADGTDQRLLSFDVGEMEDREPSWSPDGAWIAFSRWDEGLVEREIFKMPSSGETEQIRATRLTYNDGGQDSHPSWSPDGKSIAFGSDRGGNFDVYTMSAEGEPVPTQR